jgi:hypothetical protein
MHLDVDECQLITGVTLCGLEWCWHVSKGVRIGVKLVAGESVLGKSYGENIWRKSTNPDTLTLGPLVILMTWASQEQVVAPGEGMG